MSMARGVLEMELVEVPVTALELGVLEGDIVVSHVGTRLTRGLEIDEEVVVLTADGEFLSARVVDLEFDLADTRYVLRRGVRMPPELAWERLEQGDGLAPRGPSAGSGESVQSLLDLLGDLRDRDQRD